MMVAATPEFIEGLVVCESEKAARTRDVTPTWRGLLPLLLTIYHDGSDKGRRGVVVELERMAVAADNWNRYCAGKRPGGGSNG